MTVGGDGTLTCRFVMPFAKRAVLTIASSGPGLTIEGSAVVDARPFGPDALLFHAGWRLFWNQQHGDNVAWEIIPDPHDD